MSLTTTVSSIDAACTISKQARIDDNDNYSTSDDIEICRHISCNDSYVFDDHIMASCF